MAANKFVIEFKRAPGDELLLTGLVRDLKLTYGDRYQVNVVSQFPGLWRHNPYLAKLDARAKDVRRLNFGSHGPDAVDRRGMSLSKSGQRIHYLTAFHREFERRTGIHVPVLFSRADIHFSDEEKASPHISQPYWVVVPGGKTDTTNKWWHQHRWQEVVDLLRADGLRFVQEGATRDLCYHPPLNGVLNVVGATSIRDLIVNIYHAEGVICGVTFQMHIAGALEKPCVVIFGGREEPWYEAYQNDYKAFGSQAAPVKIPHRILHTFGALSCCKARGCWRRRVQPLPDRQVTYNRRETICLKPHRTEGLPLVPECLDMIRTDQVVAAVRSYYEEGILTQVTSDDLYVPPQIIRPMEQGTTKPNPVQILPPEPLLPANLVADVLDHPRIGGKVTICVLLFGNYTELHRRCVDSVLRTVPESRRDLRIALNQVSLNTLNYLKDVPAKMLYRDQGRAHRRKYPAMRDLFHDAAKPIATSWIVWLDDAFEIRHPRWLDLLAETIINQPESERIGLLGNKLRYTLSKFRGRDPKVWFRRSTWFQNRLFRNPLGADSPNGDQIHFVDPGFFAISAEAVRTCDVPDTRLVQSGGGICLGEQLHQGGYHLKQFNSEQKLVQSRSRQQRGYREKYPW